MSALTDKEMIRSLVDDAVKINEANKRHYQEHFDELQERYGGEIVVILDQQVIESREFTEDLDELDAFLNELKSEYGEETIKEAYISHIPDPDHLMLF